MNDFNNLIPRLNNIKITNERDVDKKQQAIKRAINFLPIYLWTTFGSRIKQKNKGPAIIAKWEGSSKKPEYLGTKEM